MHGFEMRGSGHFQREFTFRTISMGQRYAWFFNEGKWTFAVVVFHLQPATSIEIPSADIDVSGGTEVKAKFFNRKPPLPDTIAI